MSTSWTSPSHAPLRSRDHATALRGKPLTDRRIAHYDRLGWYGDDLRKATQPAKSSSRKQGKTHAVNITLDDLLA